MLRLVFSFRRAAPRRRDRPAALVAPRAATAEEPREHVAL
jgi:hypothetical protein